MAPRTKKTKVYGVRKQWKLLCEYSLARDGDQTKMSLDDTLYESGPTIGEFLMRHYLSKCVAPMIKAATAAAENPVVEDPPQDTCEAVPPPPSVTPQPIVSASSPVVSTIPDVPTVVVPAPVPGPLTDIPKKRDREDSGDPPKKKLQRIAVKRPKTVDPKHTVTIVA